MNARNSLLIVAVLLVAGYAAYPCVTLYRLHRAVRDGDVATLSRLVDWSSVREGIAEDIADTATEAPGASAVAAGAQLAPFGHGFMHAIAAHAIQHAVTPQHLIATLRRHDHQGSGFALRLAWFDAWSGFMVQLASGPGQPDVRLRLNLEDGVWRLTRVWMPPAMLRASDHPTVMLTADSMSQ
ncbi:MAG TPA: DUF2939 domain-containing protein [Acetobacteraceae bacterium]|nr:DUF2939 domain-containing protein [Acetobacteraceae bacterium]